MKILNLAAAYLNEKYLKSFLWSIMKQLCVIISNSSVTKVIGDEGIVDTILREGFDESGVSEVEDFSIRLIHRL